MQETEITVQVFESKEIIDKKLKDLGYKIIETFELNDFYFSRLKNVKDLDYQELISNSFLVRQVITDKEHTYLSYKNKTINKDGNVISEEKTNVELSELENTLKIFKLSRLNNWCNIKNNSTVYSNGTIEFAIQDIEDLGIFIEYEEDNSVSKLTNEQKIKQMFKTIKSLGLKIGSDYSCKKIYMKFKQIK